MIEAYYHRHSKANYNEYNKIMAGENPEAPFDHKKQDSQDISEAGISLAREKAKEFFDGLDPKTDVLFFVSSNEARAIDTADIYRREAKARGFRILAPDHPRSEYANQVGEGEIRTVGPLSINAKNVTVDMVFSAILPQVNWEKVDPVTKERYAAARRIIDADNRGSWGANFQAHAEEIKKIIPEIPTPQEMYQIEFRNLTRLLKWSGKKAQESGDTNLKILAFGHEEHVGYFLEKEFQAEGIKNCEAIKFTVGEQGVVSAQYRGQEKQVGLPKRP